MNYHRTDRAINSIIGDLENLSIQLPQARNALLDARNQIDGYITGGENSRVMATSELTRTEAAVAQREHIDRQLKGLNDELDAIALGAKNLRNDCRRYIATITTPTDLPRCSATGRQGAIEWADPTCTEIPERTTLCIRCYHRERRWRIAHGLPTREDSAE